MGYATWGAAADELAGLGRVIGYDRRGYARSGGEPVRTMSTHTADAAALLEHLQVPPAVVVGTSAGAAVAVDLAVRRPDLVRAVVAHEFHGAAETLLRSAYTYRDGRSAWDAFPPEWRRVARDNAAAALADFRNSIGTYPAAAELATITVPVVCSYGGRSPDGMVALVRSLASSIPTATVAAIDRAGHAAPFDAPANFVRLIADSLRSSRPRRHVPQLPAG